MKQLVENGIYELIKTLSNGDVYFMRAPDNKKPPFIIIQRTDSERFRAINNPSGIAQAKLQIDAYDKTYIGAKELGAQIETILDGYQGVVSYGDDDPQNEVDISGVSLQNEFDSFDQTVKPFLFRSLSNYIVTYKQ